MTMRFDQLETKQEWAEALETLLDKARTAVEANDAAKRRAAKKDLRDFVDASPFDIGLECDDLARDAIDMVTKAELAEDLGALEGIAFDIAALGKQLDQLSAK